MGKRLLLAVAVFALLAVAAAGIGVLTAHRAIRGERVPLPDPVALAAAVDGDDLPMRLSVLNTASQETPRSAVLDSGSDPSPDARYVMSHPAFVLEWGDGRILLVDVGMTEAGAEEFARPLAWIGAGPVAAHGSTRTQLGDAASRVRGLAFTHLHVDHVGGVGELCAGRSEPLPVLAGTAQADRPNYTTRPGRRLLDDARCVRIDRLEGDGALALPGFPGVALVRAAGHTPGSQIFAVAVRSSGGRTERWLITGDTVNALDGVRHDLPKPFLYRTLLIPEDEERQQELRRWLRDLVASGWRPLVPHDGLELERSGAPQWSAAPGRAAR